MPTPPQDECEMIWGRRQKVEVGRGEDEMQQERQPESKLRYRKFVDRGLVTGSNVSHVVPGQEGFRSLVKEQPSRNQATTKSQRKK